MELAELSLKLSRFEGLSTKFHNLQSEIEVLNSHNLDIEIDGTRSYREWYYFLHLCLQGNNENENIQFESYVISTWIAVSS